MQKKKRDHFTFMLIPHSGAKEIINLHIPYVWLFRGAIVLGIIAILVISSLVYSSALTRKLVTYSDTLSKNKIQQEIIDKFSAETNQLKLSIKELLDRDNQLRKLLGLKLKKSEISLNSENSPQQDLRLAEKAIEERKISFEELKGRVNYVQGRFDSTPSIWPADGRISSFFGYRRYPWRGFHSGVDISTHYGGAIKAAAAGAVTHAGWHKGYGRTIIVDHGHGISTLYGHCSKLAAEIGAKVKKGQTIAYVGRSGWATGPHLHYEVRRYEKAINPVAFLNLNILTASKVIE